VGIYGGQGVQLCDVHSAGRGGGVYPFITRGETLSF